MLDKFGGILQEAIELGEFRDLNVRETIISMTSLVYGSVVWACYSHDDRPLTERTLHAVDIFFDGIRVNQSSDQGTQS